MERVTIRQRSEFATTSQETEIILESEVHTQKELKVAALLMMERMGHDVALEGLKVPKSEDGDV